MINILLTGSKRDLSGLPHIGPDATVVPSLLTIFIPFQDEVVQLNNVSVLLETVSSWVLIERWED